MNSAPKRAFAVALLALPALAASLPTAKPEDVGLSSERLQRIEQMIQRRVDAGEMAGAVDIVARKGKIVHFAAVGQRDIETKQPMTKDTIFRVASMTKPITGIAVMMMIEEGKIRLTDPVSRYIPEFKDMKVAIAEPPRGGRGGGGAGRGAAPEFYTIPAEREITIRDLLTHVSGLASGAMSNSEVRKLNRRPDENLASYIPRLGSTPLEFQPGSHWAYSAQAGFDTLGRIVEIASGMPLDRFFRERIFNPLGIEEAWFWPPDDKWSRAATVYQRGRDGKLTKNPNPNSMSSKVYFMGSGGIMTTAADYLPLGVMLANGGVLNGKRLLSPKTVELMTSVHVPDTLPGRTSLGFTGEGFGLSMRVVQDHVAYEGLVDDGTFGWSGIYGTYFFVDPKEQLVAVLMAQTTIPDQRDFENLVMQSIVN